MAQFDVEIVVKLIDQLSSGASAVTQALQTIETKARTVTQATKDWADDFMPTNVAAKIKKFGDDIGEQLSDVGKNIGGTLGTSIGEGLESLGALGSKIGTSVVEGLSNVGSGVADAGKALGSKVGKSVAEGLKTLGTDFVVDMGVIGGAIGTGLTNAFSNAYPTITSGFTSFIENIKGKWQGFQDLITSFPDKLTEWGGQLAKAGAIATATFTAPGLALAAIHKQFEKAVEPLAEGRTPEQFEALKKAIKELSAEYPHARADLLKFFADAKEPLEKQVAAAKEAAEATKGVDSIFTKLDQIKERLANIAGTVGAPLAEAQTSVTDSLLAFIGAFGLGKLDALEDFLKMIEGKTEALTMFGQAWSVLSAAGPGLISAGTGIAGLAEGFKAISPLLTFGAAGAAAPWILALVALGAAFYAIYTNWEQLEPHIENIKTSFKDLFEGTGGATGLGTQFTELVKTIGELFNYDMSEWSWGGFINDEMKAFASNLGEMLKNINEALRALKEIIDAYEKGGTAGVLNRLSKAFGGGPVMKEAPKDVTEEGARVYGPEGPGVIHEGKYITDEEARARNIPIPMEGAPPPDRSEEAKEKLGAIRERLPAITTPGAIGPLGVKPAAPVTDFTAWPSFMQPEKAPAFEPPVIPPFLRPMGPRMPPGAGIQRMTPTMPMEPTQDVGAMFDLLTKAAKEAAAGAPPTGAALPAGFSIVAQGPEVHIHPAPASTVNNITVNVTSPDQAPITTANAVAAGIKPSAGNYDA